MPLAEHFWGNMGCWPQPVESAAAKPKVVIEPMPERPVDIDISAYLESDNQSGLSPGWNAAGDSRSYVAGRLDDMKFCP